MASAPAAEPQYRPLYTSIKAADCTDPSPALAASFEARGLSAQECPGPDGWRVYVSASDERSWLELAHGPSLWSSENEVVYRNTFGEFPNVGAEKLEWQLDDKGHAHYLIFRIAAQAPAGSEPAKRPSRLSRLFVLRLTDEAPSFCGVARSNQEARQLTRDPARCKTALPGKPLP
jgi:hypothetical protein